MTRYSDLPDELGDVARTLQARRPEASALDLDRIKQQARQRAVRRARAQLTQKGLLMRSRMAITALLAGGLLMLGGGAALGVSGLSSTRSAAQAQYGPTTVTTGTTTTVVQGVTTTVTVPTTVTTTTPTVDTLGDVDEGEDVPTERQAGEQAEKPAQRAARALEGEELPFTGYLAIPLLIAGLVMLVAGLALRRSRRMLESVE